MGKIKYYLRIFFIISFIIAWESLSLYSADEPTNNANVSSTSNNTPSNTSQINSNQSRASSSTKPLQNTKNDGMANSRVTVTEQQYLDIYDELADSNVPKDEIRSEVESQVGETTVNKSILNPVFIISEGLKSFNYVNANLLCNIVNLAREGIECLVYPVENKAEIYSYLRRGLRSDNFNNTGVNGDFLILRADEYSQYLQGKGPFVNAPKLDLVAYLNGDYFFVMAPRTKNVFNVDQLIYSMDKKKINILALNQQSKAVFNNLVKPLYPRSNFVITDLSATNIKKQICATGTYDLMIFLGTGFPEEIRKSITTCALALTPVSFSDENISQILARNKMFVSANVVSYYNALSVLNFIEIFLSVEKAYKDRLEEKNKLEAEEKAKAEKIKEEEAKRKQAEQEEKSRSANKKTTKNTKTKTPVKNKKTVSSSNNQSNVQDQEVIESQTTLTPKEQMMLQNGKKIITVDPNSLTDEDKELLEKAKSLTDGSEYNLSYLNKEVVLRGRDLKSLNGTQNTQGSVGVFPNLSAYSKNKEPRKIVDISADAVIKSFGVRYVVVASRYTKRDHVFKFFNGIVKNYTSIKDDFLSPDMKKYTAIDIALGNENQTKLFTYHVGVYRYARIMLEKKSAKTYDQALVIRNLSIGLSDSPAPLSFGPKFPNEEQLNYIYGQIQSVGKKKLELNAVKILQRDLKIIEETLSAIEKNENVSDSLLEATGLGLVYKTTTIKRPDPIAGNNLQDNVAQGSMGGNVDIIDQDNTSNSSGANNSQANTQMSDSVPSTTANSQATSGNVAQGGNKTEANSNPQATTPATGSTSTTSTPATASGNPAISSSAANSLAVPD